MRKYSGLIVCTVQICLWGWNLLGTLKVDAQDYLPLSYSTKDGLPSDMVYGTVQDRYGQIWIATDRGLSRFDGQSFRNYSRQDGLEDLVILDVFIDSQDRLWMSSYNGRLAYLKNGKIYHSRNSDILRNWKNGASIFSVSEGVKGNIYVKTSKSLYFYHEQKGWAEIPGLSNYRKGLYRVLTYNNKEFFIGSAGLFKWDRGTQKLKLKYPLPTMSLQNVNALHASACIANHSYVGFNSKGVFKVDMRQEFSYEEILEDEESKTIARNMSAYQQVLKFDQLNLQPTDVKRIIATKDCYWLLLLKGGALQVWENGSSRLILKNLLINDIDQDRDGNYWLSSSSGLYLLPAFFYKARVYAKKDGLPHNEVFSLHLDESKKLWMGFLGGKMAIKQHDTIQNISLFPEDNVLQIRSILPYRNGLFLGMYNRGLVYLTERYKTAAQSKLQFPVFAQTLNKSPLGKLTYAHMATVFQYNEPTRNFDTIYHDPKERRIFLHHWDDAGQLWLSKPDGLAYLDSLGHLQELPSTENSILKEQIMAMENLGHGQMLLAPLGFGVILLEKGQIRQQLTTKDGLPDNICTKFVKYKNQIWVICATGIAQIEQKQGHLYVKRYFDRLNALVSNKINDLVVDDQHLYVATDQGLIVLTQDNSINKVNAPEVRLTSVRTRLGEQIQLADSRINAGDLPISIRFNILVYPSNRMIEYQYRIGKQSWISASGGALELAELSHGSYNLQLRAKVGAGEWGEVTNYKFSVHTPFYLRSGFASIVIIVILLIGIFWYFRYIIKQENHKREALSNQMLLDRLESQALQSVMHPHFMFNALNSIQHFLNANDRLQANRYLSRFAKLMRINLNAGTKGYISVEDEVERLQHYLSLEALRLENVFTYDFEIDANLIPNATFIPAMLLQPYVENALWHGLATVETNGHLWIRFKWIDAQQIEVRIEDDGIGVKNSSAHKKASPHRSQAIEIIRKRLEVFSRQFGVDFAAIHSELKPENLDRPGHVVSIQLPFVDQHILEELL